MQTAQPPAAKRVRGDEWTGWNGRFRGVGSLSGHGLGRQIRDPTAGVESCSALAPTYAGSGCTRACTAARCRCDPFPASYVACHPELGCLTGVDCNVACERELENVVECVGDFRPCDEDAH